MLRTGARGAWGYGGPGALEVARIPSVIVPVCVVKGVSAPPCVDETPCVEATKCVSGVVASVPECVLPSTPCMSEGVCVTETPCMSETLCVNEAPCESGTTCVPERARMSEARCVSGTALYVREMTVGMREHAASLPV